MKFNFFDSPEKNLQDQSKSILDIKQTKNKERIILLTKGVIIFKVVHVLSMILFNMEERMNMKAIMS